MNTHLRLSSRIEKLEYPYKKSWVVAAALMAFISITFAVLVLFEEEVVVVPFYSINIILHPLLLYFLFVLCLTAVILVLKIYLYSTNEESSDFAVVEEDAEKLRTRWKWNLIILLGLTIAAFFVPMILLNFLNPLWWFISFSGFVPGITLPELIIFLLYRKKLKRNKNASVLS